MSGDSDDVSCQVSDAGVKFIAGFEGFRASQYNDVAGYATIGYGHRILAGETFGDVLTQEEGFDLLTRDLNARVQSALDSVKVSLEQNQVDALASFIFNVGSGAFASSTLLSELNQGHYDAVPSELDRWNKAGGQVRSELVQRRTAEGLLWSNGTYE